MVGTRLVNARRVMMECLASAFSEGQDTDCDLLVLHVFMGHKFQDMLNQAREVTRPLPVCNSPMGSMFMGRWRRQCLVVGQRCCRRHRIAF